MKHKNITTTEQMIKNLIEHFKNKRDQIKSDIKLPSIKTATQFNMLMVKIEVYDEVVNILNDLPFDGEAKGARATILLTPQINERSVVIIDKVETK